MSARPAGSQVGDPDHPDDKTAAAIELLRRIGEDLDRRKKLVALRGGLLMPSRGRPSTNSLGEETSNDRSRKAPWAERPTARQGEGPAAGDSGRAWPGGTAGSILRESGIAPAIVADVEHATDAQKDGYDQLRARLGRHGTIWLEGEIWPVLWLEFGARVRVAYPTDESLPIRAWASWTDTGRWIGPRHTNFGDGSICAYEQTDGDWMRGNPLVNYLDLVAAWIARHAYLRLFDRWPGWQVLHTARERLTEHRPGEICGGCKSGRPYEWCHRPRDCRLSPQQVDDEYRRRYGQHLQLPPADETGFARAALNR